MEPRTRRIVIFAVLGLFALVGGAQGVQYMWRHGFSKGERTGVIRKISVKGSPVCKCLSGELVLAGGTAMNAEVWEFTVDNNDDDDPVVKALHEAERSSSRITLKYRQDKPLWWTCNPLEYKVVDVVK